MLTIFAEKPFSYQWCDWYDDHYDVCDLFLVTTTICRYDSYKLVQSVTATQGKSLKIYKLISYSYGNPFYAKGPRYS